MKIRHLYLGLCVPGVVVPYAFFLPWLLDHGLGGGRFLRDLAANRISLFCAADVVISAIVLFRFAGVERREGRLERLWPVYAATLLVGVSFGLPLMLYLRQVTMEGARPGAAP
ncbi:DUF2834 domain-containing protein [Gluconacetobacter azotocaptans]|uniref:DUF2834 domain-containing protein n=1 Tax=Gluconacetobacter azotocaptans TaxID=142834 RepID=A0A7W4JUW0_9PROT|nr:DUF2834 domain-containing protein [Gluconacetobacter azotocaptans]MBB2191255.1 DUF2834 domain-containing protein [Gluconacetobacter azotocaptans]GBQ25764.1 hypothetical protein AA13594_0016 [Gluconacetobacter azotocaptans DSM 13594]